MVIVAVDHRLDFVQPAEAGVSKHPRPVPQIHRTGRNVGKEEGEATRTLAPA
jgi:hypothetical protein